MLYAVDYNIVDKKDVLTSSRDDQTMTQIASLSTGMVSYDDEQAICDKTEYAQVHKLNGYIIWELSGDMLPDMSTPLLDAANAKLLNPALDCASLDLSDSVADLIGDALGADPENAGLPSVVFYPDFNLGSCLSDGFESNWLRPSDKFDNAKVSQGICCVAISLPSNIYADMCLQLKLSFSMAGLLRSSLSLQ